MLSMVSIKHAIFVGGINRARCALRSRMIFVDSHFMYVKAAVYVWFCEFVWKF
jgi:hypothetical protein